MGKREDRRWTGLKKAHVELVTSPGSTLKSRTLCFFLVVKLCKNESMPSVLLAEKFVILGAVKNVLKAQTTFGWSNNDTAVSKPWSWHKYSSEKGRAGSSRSMS